MTSWFGDLSLSFCVEHGFATRARGDTQWQSNPRGEAGWLRRVEEMLRRVEAEVDGSEVERKPWGVAWHYPRVDAEYGEWRARELRLHLEEQLASEHVDILLGRKVVEVRAGGAHKRRYIEVLGLVANDFVLAVGDEHGDAQVHGALPGSAVIVHVGGENALDRPVLESPAEARALLGRIAAALTGQR